MAKTHLRGINTVRKRLADGSVAIYRYHRASGAALPGEPGSSEFLTAYAEAERARPRDAGTVAALMRTYSGSVKFTKKAASTRREYIRMLTKLEAKFGTMPLTALASPRVRAIFLDYQEEIGRKHPREADNRLSVLSAVFSYAASRGTIRENPIKGFERLYKSDRADMIWTEADVARFMERAPLELQHALILAMSTGQRYGDLIRIRWSDYSGDEITLRQSKGGAPVRIPCLAALRAMLDGMERRGPYILTRTDGRPWFTDKDDKALSKAWRKHAQSVGITDLHSHDLRGTAVTTMNDGGLSLQQIALVTGHTFKSVATILERYSARGRRLNEAAILAWENAQGTSFANRLQTVTNEQATKPKKGEQ